MKGSLIWRGIVIAAVTLGAALLAFPLSEKIRLGLDLKGGMHLVLEVQTEKALERAVIVARDGVSQALRKRQAIPVRVEKTSNRAFYVEFADAAGAEVLKDIVAKDFIEFRVGPSQAGFEVGLTPESSAAIANRSVEQALEIIRNRVDQFGVAEPDIARSGIDRIVVQLPGLSDPARAKQLIGTTAQLEFKIVKATAATEEELLARPEFNGRIPTGYDVYRLDQANTDGTRRAEVYLLSREADVSGSDLKDAQIGNDEYGGPAVDFQFNARGARVFGSLTEQSIGKQLAIVLDNKVRSAPVIQSRISDRGQITGRFTLQEAKDLAVVLRSGALPAPVVTLEENTVDPSLGKQVVKNGVNASFVGAALVVVFMFLYYNLSGLLACFAMGMNILLLLAAMGYYGATMTLPGIAGIALTIGMSVDANVLIYERIREELKSGKTVSGGIDTAYAKVFWTILDSNVTTILAAVCLYRFGTGPIRGFATTLTVGLIANMFTAVFVTKWVYDLFTSGRSLKRLSI
jgi:preprotein translocase subunit SecD